MPSFLPGEAYDAAEYLLKFAKASLALLPGYRMGERERSLVTALDGESCGLSHLATGMFADGGL